MIFYRSIYASYVLGLGSISFLKSTKKNHSQRFLLTNQVKISFQDQMFIFFLFSSQSLTILNVVAAAISKRKKVPMKDNFFEEMFMFMFIYCSAMKVIILNKFVTNSKTINGSIDGTILGLVRSKKKKIFFCLVFLKRNLCKLAIYVEGNII